MFIYVFIGCGKCEFSLASNHISSMVQFETEYYIVFKCFFCSDKCRDAVMWLKYFSILLLLFISHISYMRVANERVDK